MEPLPPFQTSADANVIDATPLEWTAEINDGITTHGFTLVDGDSRMEMSARLDDVTRGDTCVLFTEEGTPCKKIYIWNEGAAREMKHRFDEDPVFTHCLHIGSDVFLCSTCEKVFRVDALALECTELIFPARSYERIMNVAVVDAGSDSRQLVLALASDHVVVAGTGLRLCETREVIGMISGILPGTLIVADIEEDEDLDNPTEVPLRLRCMDMTGRVVWETTHMFSYVNALFFPGVLTSDHKIVIFDAASGKTINVITSEKEIASGMGKDGKTILMQLGGERLLRGIKL